MNSYDYYNIEELREALKFAEWHMDASKECVAKELEKIAMLGADIALIKQCLKKREEE